jgi:glycosyltransferase involved in cell wall biosynthesis
MTADRLAVLLHDFAPGGSERIAIRLANEWARQGRAVTLLTGNDSGALRAMVDDAVAVITADPPVRRGRGMRRLLARRLPGLIAAARPALLFVPGNYHFPVAARFSRRAMRPAIVAKLSNPVMRKGRGRLAQALFDAVLRLRLSRVDAVVAMSPALAAEAEAVIGAGRVIPIAQPSLADEAVSPGAAVAAPVIVAAGRFVAQKRFDLLLEAMAHLATPAAELILLGDGPARAALSARARRLGLGARVVMPGYVDDIRDALDRARLCVISSDYEGYPAVAIEALAAGVPLVATDCSPAIREILSKPSLGTVVPPGDASALAKAIDAQLSAPAPDRAMLAGSVTGHRIGAIARDYLALFDRLAR